ncbi:MAG: 3-keto-5-aminohexanoate cleavage protein [Bacillota bacterium]|jgi:3-keto-5-aminohexanoate cleavage enzyme|nr:3-keto-5-aminohexanoate cleavage protein [Bacillota bacterium]HOC07173.1 3-keto-5-aminohexanoate cleavage protein [Bacillota bacterium]
MDKLIITAALTGAETTKEANPALPVTPEEIAEAAFLCREAGASIVHLHARKPDGSSTQDPGVFGEIISGIRQRTDVIIQVSTGGAVGMTPEERLQPVQLNPEMATLSTGSVNFGEDLFVNTMEEIRTFARTMIAKGVKPEIEAFDSGMVQNALTLVKEGILELPLHFDFVLGVPGAMPGTPEALMYMRSLLPAGCTWTVAGIGRTELPLGAMAIILGGHVRVGFEDNIYYKRGQLAESNAQLVQRMVRLAEELGREVATPEEARKILHL